jgi:hypothetical protein
VTKKKNKNKKKQNKTKNNRKKKKRKKKRADRGFDFNQIELMFNRFIASRMLFSNF